MAALTLDPSLNFGFNEEYQQQRVIIEEIEGIIKVYKDGIVERPQIVPNVTCELPPSLGVTSRDVMIDKLTNIWARFYVPKSRRKLPLLIYFHGGGFCVGSASWSCYHEFLAKFSAKANCVIMSVNYRLAPENSLPAAYNDGFKALMWVKQQSSNGISSWWSSKCNFSNTFLGGDSAGANIAYNVATSVDSRFTLKPLTLKGTILIQPFFGGEMRTNSEKYSVQPPRSALTLASSDTYWRLSLPVGENRDHPWCNPIGNKAKKLGGFGVILPTLVCIAEMDILKDRNLELCDALVREGKNVEHVVCKGVGHAFQILNKSPLSLKRTIEMISHIKAFMSR